MWTVNPLELGPLYPWAGGAWEVIMWIGSVVLWVGWHLLADQQGRRQLSRRGGEVRHARGDTEGDRRLTARP